MTKKLIVDGGAITLSLWGEGRGEGAYKMRSGLVGLARDLRSNETRAEHLLWSKLRNRQVDGWKFKRQVPFGHYILDFFCSDARLAVEVDGATHCEPHEQRHDQLRTEFLATHGVHVLRVTNADVMHNINGVLETIYSRLGQKAAPSPGAARRPLPKGRGSDGAH